MMAKILLFCLIIFAMHVTGSVHSLETKGTTFCQMSVTQATDETGRLSINWAFHRCSLSQACNFVGRNTRSNQASMYANERDIPHNNTLVQRWKKMQPDEYRVYFERATWSNARAKCKQAGGDLASIANKAEEKSFQEQMSKVNGKKLIWTGLKKSIDGSFVWIDGTRSTYFVWHSGEPNNANGGENCGAIQSWAMEMIDYDCDAHENFFICKFVY